MALTYVKDNRMLDIKGVITLRDGTQKQIAASDVISYRVSESIGGQALGLGTAESASFNLTLNNSDRTYSESDLDNAEVHMYIGLQTNGTIVYSDLGVWYVQNTRASEQSTSVEITGNDALSILFNAEYVDSESVYPTTIGSLATAACAAAGVPLKSNSFANAAVSVAAMPKWKAKVTLRDIVGYCAACAGGFARISRDGKLEICSYMDGAQHSLSPSSYMSYSARGGASFKFNAIEVKFSSDDDEFSRYAVNASIADNATNTIQIEGNPLMTSTIVQSIVNEFKGLNTSPMELGWIGDPDVHCGDKVVLTDTRGSTHTSIINSQTLTFDGGFSMDSKCSLPNLTSTRGASYTTSGNLMDAEGNVRATRISGLDKSVVSATTGHFENLTAETIKTDQLLASVIEAIKLRAENIDASSVNTDSLTAAVASIIEATIKKINAGVITSDELIANIGTIVALKANSITADTIQTDALAAALGRFVSLYAGTGEFDLATIQNLLSNALILQEGVADSMMITNLAVTSANLLNATIDKLVLKGSDGKYYRVFIGADGTIQTEEVTVTDGEIEAGETGDGRQIVATTANVGSLNATTVKASQAIIGTIFTESLTAGKITANEALIASMTAPLIYTTAITALGNSLDLSANESIRLTVGSSLATATVEYALSDSRTEAPTTGWSATAPEWTDGKYMWQRTTWTKRDGTKTVSDPTCIAGATGAKGEDGTGIASVTAEYYLSTSKDEPTGGEWLETPPTWTTGKYMWTRTKITYKNPPSTETTEPVCDSTWEITNGLKDDIDAVSNAAETALGLAEVAQDAANGAQETANGAQESANQANERASILETQLTLTQEGLSVVRTETIPGLEGRVETIESGVHIAGSEIGIYTSDSPFRNTITNNGWVISEDGAPIITCAETKLTAPRVMVSDAFIIGGLAWKPGEDKHVRLLKYGRLS